MKKCCKCEEHIDSGLIVCQECSRKNKKHNGEWISVKDRLPQKDTHVIAHFDDGFITGVEFTDDWELWAESGEVTHWMLLPAPLKTKRGAK